jgi:hypothetical protein
MLERSEDLCSDTLGGGIGLWATSLEAFEGVGLESSGGLEAFEGVGVESSGGLESSGSDSLTNGNIYKANSTTPNISNTVSDCTGAVKTSLRAALEESGRYMPTARYYDSKGHVLARPRDNFEETTPVLCLLRTTLQRRLCE